MRVENREGSGLGARVEDPEGLWVRVEDTSRRGTKVPSVSLPEVRHHRQQSHHPESSTRPVSCYPTPRG